jgi:hypothetical protein
VSARGQRIKLLKTLRIIAFIEKQSGAELSLVLEFGQAVAEGRVRYLSAEGRVRYLFAERRVRYLPH